jgi:cyclopropane fatty-acyl-phospholipid synthase-like methyltransferase
MLSLILAAVAAIVVGVIVALLLLGSTVKSPELFMDFLKLTSPQMLGSFTLVYAGKSFTLGTPRPPYRPVVLRVHDPRFFGHVLTYRNLGLGEAYMFGWFDLDPGTPENPNADLYDMFTLFFVNGVDRKGRAKPPVWLFFRTLSVWLVYKFHGHKRAIDVHYNENPEMYRDMLGTTQAYTCGYVTSGNSALPNEWRSKLTPVVVDPQHVPPIHSLQDIEHLCVQTGSEAMSEYLVHPLDCPNLDLHLDLDGIQRAKFDRVCRKLRLRPGQRLLDMGCGYGGFLIHAAKHYGIHGVGFAITQQMIDGAVTAARAEGVSDQLKFHRGDLSSLNMFEDSFDAISAIGLFEHVHNYEYTVVFDRMQALLKHDGMLMLHMMCSPTKPNHSDSFIQTYVFPNSHQNLVSDLMPQLEIRSMRVLDMEDISHHYTYTLHCWWTNLKRHFDGHPGKYPFAYQKMMEYYLLSCKAMSAHGSCGLQQILVCKNSRGQFRGIHRYS